MMSLRTTMIRSLAVVVLPCLGVTGCTTATSGWVSSYRPASKAKHPRSDAADIRFERVHYELLGKSHDLPGYEVLGVSHFRAALEKTPPDARESPLRRQAAKVGAHYVRWAERTVGTKGALVPSAGGTLGVVTTVADYLAVFYRESAALTEK